jgi:hypothetical protein
MDQREAGLVFNYQNLTRGDLASAKGGAVANKGSAAVLKNQRKNIPKIIPKKAEVEGAAQPQKKKVAVKRKPVKLTALVHSMSPHSVGEI